MKKIISIFCLCVFICINIINPIKVFAYNEGDMNTEVTPSLTDEQFYDSYTGSIIAGALQNGGAIYIPKGFHVDDLYTNVYDVAENFLDTFIDNYYDDYQEYFMKHPPTTISVDSSYAWAWEDDQKLNPLNMPIPTYELLNDFLGRSEQPEFPLPEDPVNPNYLPYVEIINGKSFNYQYNMTDNWISLLSSSTNHVSGYSLNGSGSNYSFLNKNWSYSTQFNQSGYRPYYVAIYDNNLYKLNECYTLEHVSIYINSVNNQYQITTSTLTPKAFLHGNSYGDSYTCAINYDNSQSKITGFSGRTTSIPSLVSFSATKNTLEECFQLISMRWRNVNIYVDGNLWSSVSGSSVPSEPIAIGGLTYFPQTDTQVQYKYPDGTYFNPNILKSILRQLIESNNTENGIYVKMDDILEAFTDINGVTAVYTLVVHRNDYDQLIIEQYGNKRITTQNGLSFPKDDLQPYTNVSTYITQSSISIIPSDILSILGACGIIILIAYLINRLLE